MLNRKNSGFTLVEIMVAMLIFSLFMAALFLVLTVGQNSWQVSDVRIELQQDLRRAMDWMSDELRQSGSSVITGVPANGIFYNEITFRIPSGVTAGSISWQDADIFYFLGGLNGQQLLRNFLQLTEVSAWSEQRVLANNITSLQIRRQLLTPNIVEVVLGAQKTAPNGTPIGLNLGFQIKLRN